MGKVTSTQILEHLAQWLDEPRNRCIADRLELLAVSPKSYRKMELHNLVLLRACQGLGVHPDDLSEQLIGRCVKVVWGWFYLDRLR